MAGLVPPATPGGDRRAPRLDGACLLAAGASRYDVDAQDKPGHDDADVI
jgi:hypothetical protein